MAASRDRTLYVLSGPTAVGKTELSLAWAEKYQGEIVSCDSLLFYRGMDLGTAKPTAEELRRVPHHLIDLCSVAEQMDVTRYVERARAAVIDIQARGRRVLVVGGSGFYLKSFFAAIADDVEVPVTLRLEIAEKLAKLGLGALVDDLIALNPGGIGKIDTANPRRVVRALERCRASGRTLVELAEAFARVPKPFADWETHLTVLDRSPHELLGRVEQRVDAMLRAGLVEEVRRLSTQGLKDNPSAARAIGYRETLACLAGELSVDQLKAAIVHNTKALIKKQRTWFRTQLPAHRIITADTATVENLFTVPL